MAINMKRLQQVMGNSYSSLFQEGNNMFESKKIQLLTTILLLSFVYANTALANPITFRGQNAALFPDANPSDTAALMNSVVKPATKPVAQPTIDPATLITQGLESQITNKIYAQIFNTANQHGSFTVSGGTTITYDRPGDGTIHVTIVNASGKTTEIVLPDI